MHFVAQPPLHVALTNSDAICIVKRMTRICDHKDIIEQWEKPLFFAQDVGIEPSYARCIKARNSIPSDLWPAVIRAAKKRKKSFITWELLHKTRKQRPKAAA